MTNLHHGGLVAYFALCQSIGGELEDKAESIKRASKCAPAWHKQIIKDLEETKLICDRAIDSVNHLQQTWRGR